MDGGIYTDLAMEARELNPEIIGVTEQNEADGEIKISRITVESDDAAKKLGKAKGLYVSLDAPDLITRPLDLFEHVSTRLGSELSSILSEKARPEGTFLIVGLGNRSVTPDSLGPRVAEMIYVTRHIKEYMPEAIEFPTPAVCSIAPGVLGVTGVETVEIVKGVVESVKPDLIIAIDSLASRRAARISTTIQLSDAGISPGSGVGNTRAGLNSASLGIPVIAIGVPLVVYASTISQDTIELIANETGLHNDESRLKELAEQVIAKHMGTMIVTPKDIDSIVGDMSKIIADAINLSLFGEHVNEIKSLIA